MSSAMRQIGVVTRPHGLRGEVKVRPETDDPTRFESLDHVLLGDNSDQAQSFRIEGVRLQEMQVGTAVVLALEGVSDRNSAQELAGLPVWVDESALPPLEEDEVYVSDLVGLEVWEGTDRLAGTVADVLDLPAQLVLVVRRTSGGEALVPFVPDLIESVDERRIVVRPVEGLLDPENREEVA